MHQDAAAAETR